MNCVIVIRVSSFRLKVRRTGYSIITHNSQKLPTCALSFMQDRTVIVDAYVKNRDMFKAASCVVVSVELPVKSCHVMLDAT
jgi:hypothetical protein